MRHAAIGLALAIATAPPAIAQGDNQVLVYRNGNTLFYECTSDVKAFQTLCSSYILGVTDTYLTLSKNVGFGSQYCLRPSVVAGQLQDVVTKYLVANPSARDEPAPVLIVRALREAFPCQAD